MLECSKTLLVCRRQPLLLSQVTDFTGVPGNIDLNFIMQLVHAQVEGNYCSGPNFKSPSKELTPPRLTNVLSHVLSATEFCKLLYFVARLPRPTTFKAATVSQVSSQSALHYSSVLLTQ